jgi:hypothetical protein
MEINILNVITLLLGEPASTSRFMAVALIGIAIGLLAGHLRSQAKSGRCPTVRGVSIGERARTLVWTITSGVVATVSSHWFLSSGAADYVIRTIKRLIIHGSFFG